MTAKEYNECVKKYSDDLYRFALRYTNDGKASEDAVQDCFVRLWEQRDKIVADLAKGWLMRVLYRQLIDRHRHLETIRNAIGEMAREENSHHDSTRFELRDAIQKALDQLPDIQRQLVLLKDLQGYGYSEMAELTGLTEQQVGVYLFRARKTLKEKLRTQDSEVKMEVKKGS